MKKPAVIAAALALSVSSLAFAQTSPSTSPSQSPRAAPPAGGSGTSAPARPLTKEDVKPGLEGAGFTDVTEVEENESGFTAKAKRSGQPVTLEIDRTGRVAMRR
jgi:hypothetical protein